MNTRPYRTILIGLMSSAILALAGCTIDVGTAARSSLTSFLTTLANSAISDAINP